jgi:radical SAM superfamily enzyme YgiQ (UPF0313 family)
MSRLDLVLLFPPVWLSVPFPYLALPALTASLRERGVSVAPIDLNLELAHYLCSGEVLRGILSNFFSGRLPAVGLPTPARPGHRRSRSLHRGDYAAALRVLGHAAGLHARYPAEYAAYYLSGVGDPEVDLRELVRSAFDQRRHPAIGFLATQMEQSVLPLRPRVIGFTIADSTQLLAALAMASHAKARLGHRTTLVLGGPWCTIMADTMGPGSPLFDAFDYIVVGAGEEPLARIIADPGLSERNEVVPGLSYRRRDGGICSGRPEPVDLRLLPPPDFSDYDLRRYADFGDGRPLLPLEATRGCNWARCRFCNYHSLGTGYSIKTVEQVVREMESLARRYPGCDFSFIDNISPAPFLTRLSRALLERGTRVRWSASVRADTRFTASLCRTLRQAGCICVFIGMESGTQRLLDLIDKGISVTSVTTCVGNFQAAGIDIASNFIVGLPTETEDEVGQTMSFIESLHLNPRMLTVSEFKLARGSHFFRQARSLVQDPELLSAMDRSDLRTTFSLPRDYSVEPYLKRWESPEGRAYGEQEHGNDR